MLLFAPNPYALLQVTAFVVKAFVLQNQSFFRDVSLYQMRTMRYALQPDADI